MLATAGLSSQSVILCYTVCILYQCSCSHRTFDACCLVAQTAVLVVVGLLLVLHVLRNLGQGVGADTAAVQVLSSVRPHALLVSSSNDCISTSAKNSCTSSVACFFQSSSSDPLSRDTSSINASASSARIVPRLKALEICIHSLLTALISTPILACAPAASVHTMRPSKRIAVAKLAANRNSSSSLSEYVDAGSSDQDWDVSAAEADSSPAGCKRRNGKAAPETTGDILPQDHTTAADA